MCALLSISRTYMKIDVILMPRFFPGCRLHSFLHGVDTLMHVYTSKLALKMMKRKRKRVQLIKPKHDVISAHSLYCTPRWRKYRNTTQVYLCNIFQAFSFKMNSQKSNSHKESLHSANCTMFLKLSAIKKLAKMKESLYLGTFTECLSSCS